MAWKKFVACFDNHGDKQLDSTVDVFKQFVSTWKPQLKIHGGDNWDFRPLRKKVSEDEKRESMLADYHAGMEFLKWYQPNVFVRGNHDERLYELLDARRGIETDFAVEHVEHIEKLLRKFRCKMLPYHKRKGVCRVGHLKIMHGFYAGVTAARRMAMTYGSVLFGHTHAIDTASVEGFEPRVGQNCGCLCDPDMKYNERQPGTLRQEPGFAYGVVNQKNGLYHYWQARSIGNRWFIPGDLTEYAASKN